MNLPPRGKLVVNDGDDWDGFGYSVALSEDGTTALIGAIGNRVSGTRLNGSTYVFRGSGRSKSRVATFTPERREKDAPPINAFGNTVALSDDGTTAVVGTLWNPPDRLAYAHVFSESDGSWTRTAKLRPEDSDDLGDERYGLVTLSGDGETALVGLSGATLAHAFSVSDGSWRRTATLGLDDDIAAVALSNDGTTALVGTRADEGAVYAFSRAGGSWRRDGTLPAGYVRTVALSGDGTAALLGNPDNDDPNGDDAGAAHVFSRSGSSWEREAKLVANDGNSDDGFGGWVSLSRDGATALVGARRDEDPHGRRSGSAYVFSRSGGSWSQDRKLTAGDGDSGDHFGESVALSGDASTAIVGAPDDEGNERRDGSAYVFTL
jgi:hypothetical protein